MCSNYFGKAHLLTALQALFILHETWLAPILHTEIFFIPQQEKKNIIFFRGSRGLLFQTTKGCYSTVILSYPILYGTRHTFFPQVLNYKDSSSNILLVCQQVLGNTIHSQENSQLPVTFKIMGHWPKASITALHQVLLVRSVLCNTVVCPSSCPAELVLLTPEPSCRVSQGSFNTKVHFQHITRHTALSRCEFPTLW